MAHRWVPTEAELAIIAANNNEEAGRLIGRDKTTIRRVRTERNIPNPRARQTHHQPPTDLTQAEDEPSKGLPELRQPVWNIPSGVSLDSGMWNALEGVQKQMDALSTERDEVDVELPGDEPALVVFISDWHLGHTACRMDKLRSDLETIKNTRNMYCILGGDLTDNVVTSVASRGMHHEQITPVRVQKSLIDEAVKFLSKEKILAMVLGNHDAWSISQDDFDPIEYFANKIGAPYLGAFGFINLGLRRQRYRILAAHQFRMRSSFNKTHQGKRLQDFMGDADAVFTGHTHDSAAESTHIRQHSCFIGQAGTYLRSSRYGKSLGFTNATPEMPGVVLFPERHKVLGIYDGIGDGPAILQAFTRN